MTFGKERQRYARGPSPRRGPNRGRERRRGWTNSGVKQGILSGSRSHHFEAEANFGMRHANLANDRRQVEDAVAERDLAHKESILIFLDTYVFDVRRERPRRERGDDDGGVVEQGDVVAEVEIGAEAMMIETTEQRGHIVDAPVLVIFEGESKIVSRDDGDGEFQRTLRARGEIAKHGQ